MGDWKIVIPSHHEDSTNKAAHDREYSLVEEVLRISSTTSTDSTVADIGHHMHNLRSPLCVIVT